MGELTGRRAEVYERMQRGMTAKQIADDIGVSRNSVYQIIGRLKRDGIIDPGDGSTETRAPGRTRAPKRAGILDDLEHTIQRCELRLTEIEHEETQLEQERAQLATVLERLQGVLSTP